MIALNEGKKQAEERFVETGAINTGTFNEILRGDPTSNKKYIEKMCEFFIEMKRLERWEYELELSIIIALSHLIDEFNDACDRNIISGNDKDIQQYNSILDFEQVILNSRGKLSNTQKKKKSKSENSIEFYDDDTWNLTYLLNWTAAKKIGMGTKWCIAYNRPTHWNGYVWRDGNHFYVLTNKILDRQPIPDDEKDPLYKVALQITYSGEVLNFWDAPDKSFNPVIGSGMTPERQLWWDSVPEKIKNLIRKPEPEGESRKILVNNYSPVLGYNEEKNIEQIKFKDFYINSNIPPIDFSKLKNVDVQITGNIIVSDTDFTSLDEINFSMFPTVESIKIEGNKKLKNLKGLPHNISGSLTIENNPELGNDAIADLLPVNLRRHLTWMNNKEKTSIYDFINHRWAPILGKINAK